MTMIEEFKNYIKQYEYVDMIVDYSNEEEYKIETNYGYAKIIFNDQDIIELIVTNTHTQNVDFYLHFQIKSMAHAKELFNEMIEAIEALVDKPIFRVLLCCSGGLTTSYFANLIKEKSKDIYPNYIIEATSYLKLYDVGANYDLVMLAPQISYIASKAQAILKDKVIVKIPPKVFASYDVGEMLSIIHSEDNKHKHPIRGERNIIINRDIKEHGNILAMSLIQNTTNRIHFMYRLFNKDNEVIDTSTIIKPTITLSDIMDAIDVVLLAHTDIESIGLSMPGVIKDGEVSSSELDGIPDHEQVLGILKARYSQDVYLNNDVNTMAVGCYVSQKEYENVACLFQPTTSLAGVGSVVDGKLLVGNSHIAGEVAFLPLDLSDDAMVLNKTPEGQLELVAKTLVSVIAVTDPQLIVICSSLITDVESLKQEINKYIPEKYIPKISLEEWLHEYALLGQMMLCTK